MGNANPGSALAETHLTIRSSGVDSGNGTVGDNINSLRVAKVSRLRTLYIGTTPWICGVFENCGDAKDKADCLLAR